MAHGMERISVSSPPELQGPGDSWTPEHLYVAAANACLMFTFLAMARDAGLQVLAYRAPARGKVENALNGWRVTEVMIQPEVEVGVGETERAATVMKKAEALGLISRSMHTKLNVTPQFIEVEKTQITT